LNVVVADKTEHVRSKFAEARIVCELKFRGVVLLEEPLLFAATAGSGC
jgi:hypothetical protein